MAGGVGSSDGAGLRTVRKFGVLGLQRVRNGKVEGHGAAFPDREVHVGGSCAATVHRDLSLRREPLDREDLAWVVRRQDSDLLERLNGALAQWRVDGTRALVLDRWMPYWRTLEEYTDRLPPPARLP